jgi:hypothetical protein
MNDAAPPRPFAIYFPQFYPTPTNDRAWGQGFTDWALVAQANLRPSWSRRAPAIGYYDGSSSAVHQRQFEQMRAYGLGGMGVYHYWFQQGQELAAFESTLRSPAGINAPPWFLIWATENWSRRWIGDATSILKMSEDPSRAEIRLHCEYLLRCFELPTYWRWEGKPVFVWYNLAHFKAPQQVLEQYRAQLASLGSPVAFGHFIKNPFDLDYARLVDFNYFFEPRLFFGTRVKGRGSWANRALTVLKVSLGEQVLSRALVWLDRFQRVGTTYNASDFMAYLASEQRLTWQKRLTGPVQDVLSPGWNNTPRYGSRFTALSELDPAEFAACVQKSRSQSALPVLINAWNEWSEGAAIEPCAYFGDRYLRPMSLNNPDKA